MTHHIPSILWGMTDRACYTVNGETAVWVERGQKHDIQARKPRN